MRPEGDDETVGHLALAVDEVPVDIADPQTIANEAQAPRVNETTRDQRKFAIRGHAVNLAIGTQRLTERHRDLVVAHIGYK